MQSKMKRILLTGITVALVVTSSINAQDDACTKLGRSDGVPHGSYCYIFSVDAQMPFPEASAACLKLGSRLVTVSDDSVESFLQQQMNRKKWTRMWTGLTKSRNEHWVYTHKNTLLYEQGCYQDNATSRDLPEKVYKRPLLSFQPAITIDACFDPCKGNKYRFIGIQLLSDAKTNTKNGRDVNCFCGNSYGKYGEVAGCTESCFADPQGRTDLCGGVLKNYVYAIDSESDQNSNWAKGHPSGNGSCAVMSGSGSLLEETCGKQFRYMCMIDTTNYTSVSCSGTGYSTLGSGLTNFCVYTSTDIASWYNAYKACRALGSGWDFLHQTSATKSRVSSLAVTLAKAAANLEDAQKSFWIGAFKSSWEWYDGTDAGYHNWINGQPDPETNKCMKLYKPSTDGAGTWNSANCESSTDYKDHFACQVDPTLKYVPPTTTTTVAPKTTTVEATTAQFVVTGTLAPGNTGASEQSQGLTIYQKLLIFCAVLTVVAGIVSLSLFIYYKKVHSVTSVAPSKYETMEETNGGIGYSPEPEIFTDNSGSTWKPEKILVE